jgi:hypothetical protein
MQMYVEEYVYLHVFLMSALDGREWSASLPSHFIHITHWIGGWVDPRAGMDAVERRKVLSSWEEPKPGFLTIQQRPYSIIHWLSFPGFLYMHSTYPTEGTYGPNNRSWIQVA